ncbi:uncharacterized protein SPAPADRAFT_59932 [Spathaspora passalidarum NRRL Y-27907]|uniref:Uncharacterized protein n=1 Tax=Spathaspora passalidarum (strain NRRL Y-27907 / 11-Y1) TaxID=619300 RepID=G3AIS8_SPAPN|nr:uncharacterized protein SPAPADRAFT_59932 [Spathaspora passalidarum NRRL Y-27907]EGW34494.1 hypothetical protein SPAPADRAFT_59932 [Spathaspora passalidarum NRRL Y-27907]
MARLDNYDNHKRPELVSFDDIDYDNFPDVVKARKSMMRENMIRTEELKIAHEALRKCADYHKQDGDRNCRALALKYMKMLDDFRPQGYLGYQRNDPSK